jgi:hypothetical protein
MTDAEIKIVIFVVAALLIVVVAVKEVYGVTLYNLMWRGIYAVLDKLKRGSL